MSSPPAAFEPLLSAGRLPDWLPPVLTVLASGSADSQWVDRLAGRLGELPVPLPVAVLHDWLARTVLPPAAEVAELAGPVEELRHLHARAAAGERLAEPDWRAVLEPALRELYRRAYGYAEAYATAHASASAYAQANGFSEQGAVSFAESYAASATDANRDAFAEANAVANAALLAAAYAGDEPAALAEAYPFALVQACVRAAVNGAEPPADPVRLEQQAWLRLADGLVDSCARRARRA
ncbi:MAG: SpcZ [Actinobacteria bacterium]|nr:SpcZ [Actinomycetota bacterium]